MSRLRLFFGGAEAPVHRKMLVEAGVPNVAINFRHLMARLPKSKPWLIKDHFSEEQSVFLDSGAHAINRLKWSAPAVETYLRTYLDFVQANIDYLDYFTELDVVTMGLDWVQEQRDTLWADLAPESFVPVWHEAGGVRVLREMSLKYHNLGVPPLSKSIENRLRGLLSGSRALLHGLSFNHPYSAPGGLYSTISSASWTAPARFGETILWNHGKLHRYSVEKKDQVRTQHKSLFTAAGFDADAILDDDSREVSRYTIWAWRQMEESMTGQDRVRKIKRVTHKPVEVSVPNADTHNGHVAHTNGNHPVLADLLPVFAKVTTPDLKVLPVIGFREKTTLLPAKDGEEPTEVVQQIPTSIAPSLRHCDTCSLAGVCPEFDLERNSCAYTIPVEIRTRDQLLGALTSVLEIQAQRVLFGRMSEELQGGYPDANISGEIDRFFVLTRHLKEIEDNRDFFKVSIEKRGEVGVLSAIFGSKATENINRVDPSKADEAMKKAMG